MSISTAAKIGVGGLIGASGIFAASSMYSYSDYLTLYKPERDALSAETVVTEEITGNSEDIMKVKISSTDNTWTCVIKANLVPKETADLSNDKSAWKSYIDEKLPIKPETEPSDIKQKNKNKLVRNCSKNRKVASDESVEAWINVTVSKNENENSYALDTDIEQELFD